MVVKISCLPTKGTTELRYHRESPRFKTYPSYKPSGVEWLGEIPAHWEIRRLKSLAAVQLSSVDKKSEEGQVTVGLCNYVDVYYNEQINSDVDFMPATATKDQIRRFSLHKGDVLITKDSESWTDIAVPAVVTQDLPDVVCGYHLAHIRPGDNCDGTFLSRVFSAIGPRNQYEIAANGITRFGLTGDAIREGVFPVPPLSEQQAITAFLDRETARIDTLVAKKERLIELLQEKRTSLITRAVTKGIDPNAPIKDSGVKWIGEIPAHWEVKRLWHLTPQDRRIMYGIVLPGPHVEGGVPIVKGGDVTPDRLQLNLLSRTTREIESQYERSRLKVGDLVYAIRGSIGDVAMIPDELDGANLTQDAARVSYTEDSWGLWLLHSLKSYSAFAQLDAGALGATIRGINIRDLKRILMPVPPSIEQRAIADYIQGETAKLDNLAAKVWEAIERLRELRTALISAAVTGRIDVREEAGCK